MTDCTWDVSKINLGPFKKVGDSTPFLCVSPTFLEVLFYFVVLHKSSLFLLCFWRSFNFLENFFVFGARSVIALGSTQTRPSPGRRGNSFRLILHTRVFRVSVKGCPDAAHSAFCPLTSFPLYWRTCFFQFPPTFSGYIDDLNRHNFPLLWFFFCHKNNIKK